MNSNNIVIDGHNDTMMHIIDEDTWLPIKDIGEDSNLHIDIGKLREGGLNTPIFAAFTEGYYKNHSRSLSRTLAILNGIYYTERHNKSTFKVVKNLEELRENQKLNKISAIPSIEGAYCLNKTNYLGLLKQFKDIGVKILGFNWNYSNDLGEGAEGKFSKNGKVSSGGLTDLGVKALKEMEKLGIGIDVSHMNERTFWGVVENTSLPIIATHSNAYELKNHRRNLRDDQLKAIKESKGVVGAVLCPSFISSNKEVYLSDYVDHIDYMVNLIGIDYVAIGSDFDGASLPLDMEGASDFKKIIYELENRSYGKEEIDKLMGHNFLRVFGELERKEENKANNTSLSIGKISMGDRVLKDEIISLKLKEKSSVKVVLDGIEIFSKEDTLEINCPISISNKEKFHIISVELKNKDSECTRKTCIVHI